MRLNGDTIQVQQSGLLLWNFWRTYSHSRLRVYFVSINSLHETDRPSRSDASE